MVPRPFDRVEYAARLARIRGEMARRDIGLMVVTDIANQHYITGYDGWSFYTPQVVLVPVEDEEPVWVGRAMDAAGGRLTAWMRPENVLGFSGSYVQQTDRPPMGWIAALIGARGWGPPRTPVAPPAYL